MDIQRLTRYRDIAKITSLFYTVHKNDPYKIAKSSNTPTELDIREMMEHFLQKHRSHLLLYGAYQNNHLISVLIAFDYEKMRTQYPSDFVHITKELPNFETIDAYTQMMNKTQAQILYVLCVMIHPDCHDHQLAQQLMKHIVDEQSQAYILHAITDTQLSSTYRKLDFFMIDQLVFHIPHVVWKSRHIEIINYLLAHTKEKCGKYVITHTERKTMKRYYYCNRMYSDMWTEHLYEARLFNTKEYAKKISDTLKCVHQYIERLGD